MTKSIFDEGTSRNQRAVEKAAIAVAAAGWGIANVAATPTKTPKVILELVTDSGISTTDKITNDGRIRISGIEEGASWKWSADNGVSWSKVSPELSGVVTLHADGEKSLIVSVTDKDQKETVSRFDFTLDTTIEKATFWNSNGSMTPELIGEAERAAQITIREKASKKIIATVTSSEQDGKWSTPTNINVKVSGLSKPDGTIGEANGTYTLLSIDQARALAHRFSSDYSVDGKPVKVDLAKAVYKMGTGDEAWFIWAQLDRGYVISRFNSSEEWYRESFVSPKITVPHSIKIWDSANVSANALKSGIMLGDHLFAHQLRIGKVIFDDDSVPFYRSRAVTVEQVDIAGNVSTPYSSWTDIDPVVPVMLDLDPRTKYPEPMVTRYVTAAMLAEGVPLSTNVGWSESAEGRHVEKIKIRFNLREPFLGDKLVLDSDWSMDQALHAVTPRLVGGVPNVTYIYDNNGRELIFSKSGNQDDKPSFTLLDVKNIVESIKLKNPSGWANSIHVLFELIGDFPTPSSPPIINLVSTSEGIVQFEKFDSGYPKNSAPLKHIDDEVKIELVSDSGVNRIDKITNDGRVLISGIPRNSTWQWSENSGATWNNGSGNADSIIELTGDGHHTLLVKTTNKLGQEILSSFYFLLDTSAYEPLEYFKVQDTDRNSRKERDCHPL